MSVYYHRIIIFTRYSTASYNRFLILRKTKRSFCLSNCFHIVVLCCVMWSMLNCFFILSSHLTENTLCQNYKNCFFGLTAYVTENIFCRNNGNWSLTSLVTMAIGMWLTHSHTNSVASSTLCKEGKTLQTSCSSPLWFFSSGYELKEE
jgi:hypothetical protein